MSDVSEEVQFGNTTIHLWWAAAEAATPHQEGQALELLSAQADSANSSVVLVADRSSGEYATYPDRIPELLHKPWRGRMRVILTGAGLIAIPLVLQARYESDKQEAFTALDQRICRHSGKVPTIRESFDAIQRIDTTPSPQVMLDRLNYTSWAWLLFLAVVVHAIYRRSHPKHLKALREHIEALSTPLAG